MNTRLLIMLPDAPHGGLDFALPGVQLMQQFMDGLPVGATCQRLFNQPTQATEIAFEAAQFQPGLLMFQAGYSEAEADPLTEGRE